MAARAEKDASVAKTIHFSSCIFPITSWSSVLFFFAGNETLATFQTSGDVALQPPFFFFEILVAFASSVLRVKNNESLGQHGMGCKG